MQNLELTKQEKKELKNRGFVVRESLHSSYIINSFLNIFAYVFISSLYFLLFALFIGSMLSSLIPFWIFWNFSVPIFLLLYFILLFLFIINFIFSYSISGNQFIGKGGIIAYGDINSPFLFRVNNLFKLNKLLGTIIKDGSIYLLSSLSGIILTLVIIGSVSEYGGYILSFILLSIPITILGRYIFQSFHPLYAFGNLGEKIQSLSPQIKQQSLEIQDIFNEDMNFSVLHSEFEKLSSIFSNIVSLVLKLENIEKKANKGNLFDSTKYINSLRSDILSPLISLKSFLEKQKQELINSQKELSRVRVGGSEDDTSNRELASKRSESLMIELEKNITSLDEMIGNMV